MYIEREIISIREKEKQNVEPLYSREREREEEANTLLSQRAASQSDFFIKQIKKD